MTAQTKPHKIDIHVGQQVKIRRTAQDISQVKLAKALGITFQQLQKYERGTNRVSASRLWEIAAVLDTSVADFFPEEV